MGLLSRLYDTSPKDIVSSLSRRLKPAKTGSPDERLLKLSQELRSKFSAYTTSNLKSISPDEFSQYIHSRLGVTEVEPEGYSEADDLDRQRYLTLQFHWGHNHDFGDFKIDGRMGDRHILLLANFASMFSIPLDSFQGKDAFDIGCWTGGTTLLLAALGANVLAIDEVRKYTDMTAFLARSFGIDDHVKATAKSLYECDTDEFYNRFDIAYFPGVLYHISDPVIGLRILYNSLKPGGKILIETLGINSDKPFCRFGGSLRYDLDTEERINRGGWNWFLPSPSALYRMMREAGFDQVDTRIDQKARVYGYGEKSAQNGICRAGLSVAHIP